MHTLPTQEYLERRRDTQQAELRQQIDREQAINRFFRGLLWLVILALAALVAANAPTILRILTQ